MKTAEQAIHDIIWKALSPQVGNNIHESRPMEDVGYPFVDFEDTQTSFKETKSGVLPKVLLKFNVWDTEDNRKNVSDICSMALSMSQSLRDAYGFKVSLRVQESEIQIIQDRTVTPSLWRGMVTLVFDIL